MPIILIFGIFVLLLLKIELNFIINFMNILTYISEKIKLFLKKKTRISKVIINEDLNITYIFEIDIENEKEYYKSNKKFKKNINKNKR
jgi:hypothetical protein